MSTTSQPSWTFDDTTREAVDAIFAEFTNATPGCALAIYRGDEIVYANGYGMSNLEHNVPITPSSIFHIASISKQFTAMCIALLQDDGLLDVNDPVQKYVPDLPTYDHPITVRHLIHHVSGIRDQWMLLRMAGWREDDIITEDDCFDLIKRQRELNFDPNDQYMYSNSGYTLLAMIVKAVSGKSLREFAHERIFEPLGMTRTHFHDDHTEVVPGRTQGYQPRNEGGYSNSNPPFDVVGTTSLHTTVEDFAKWHHNATTGEIGGMELQKLVQTPGTFNNGKAMEYAWGLSIEEWRGHRRVGHDGADHGYRSTYFRLPDLDFGITVFANLSTVWPGQLADKVAEVVLGDHLQNDASESKDEASKEGAPEIMKVDPSAIAGVYLADETEENELPIHVILGEKDGEVFVSIWGDDVPLPVKDDGSFDFRDGFGAIWATHVEEDDMTNNICVQLPHTGVTHYSRINVSSLERSPKDFTGTFYAPELDISMQIALADSGIALVWKQRKLDDREIVLLDDNTLGMGSLGASTRLEFAGQGPDALTEFRLSGNRLRNLRFIRQG